MKILLVERHDDCRRLFAWLLEEHEVTAVAEPLRASRLLGAVRYDVVLLELSRGDAQGFALLETARREGQPYMIGLTTCEKLGEAALAAGLDVYLLKPFDAPALLEAIKKAPPLPGAL